MTRDASTYRFDADYRETAVLSDGTRVTLRLLRPEDKFHLIRGFERLSPESRYRRFLGVKGALSAAELRYLTETDDIRHLAIGAVTEDGDGIGVARFVSLADEPAVAEAAITVLDAYQGKGLGRILLQRLVAAARERGIRAFRAHVLTENAPMRALLREVAPTAVEQADGDELSIEIPLAPEKPSTPAEAEQKGMLDRLLALAAQRAFVMLGTMRGALAVANPGAIPDDSDQGDDTVGNGSGARNRLRGTVLAIKQDAANAEVTVALDGGQEILSVITSEMAARLGLAVGSKVVAMVKTKDVMLAAK